MTILILEIRCNVYVLQQLFRVPKIVTFLLLVIAPSSSSPYILYAFALLQGTHAGFHVRSGLRSSGVSFHLEVNMKALFRKIRPFIIPIIVTLIVVLLFHCIFMLGYVPTSSMEPTLETGSLILGLRHFDELETGDIIIFRYDSSYLVKRIAACEGDTLVHQNAIVTVPENCFYVLGDNAEDSHYSRYWDNPFVSYENVMAKLLLPIK